MGRRGANQTAVMFAGLGTLACGLSPSMNFLVAARFVSISRPLCQVTDYRVAARRNWGWRYLYDRNVCLILLLLSRDAHQ